ncbi:MAG: HAMP domain-containing histidine kinase [Deltaproteobacteria bacterium]|nr:HAMP domain-containing histidine kinase [Deltaproteobacteria bacterium]
MTIQRTTCFAPAELETPENVAAQNRLLAADPVVAAMLDSFPEPAVVLNRHRQIVLANDKVAARLRRSRQSLIGLRTGEAFECIHARKQTGSCGTTPFCQFCGSANAIVNAQTDLRADVQECRLLCSAPDGIMAVDLRIWATPVCVSGESFTVFAVRDTTDEKRRTLLEQLFFHDVLNAATTLKGIIKILPRLDARQTDEMRRMASDVTDQILEEIQAQRDLAAAERGDLAVQPEEVDVAHLLASVCELYGQDALAAGKMVAAPRVEGSTVLRSVPLLLRRVLGNLIKNAVEACGPGDTVTVSFEDHGVPTFRVHNPGVMSAAVQAQLFQRSFTTKAGAGRGLGAYSVKLFVDNYLGGSVAFASTAQTGTTFTVTLPGLSNETDAVIQ